LTEELDSVPVRVSGVKAPVARKVAVPGHLATGASELGSELVDIVNEESWMCLGRREEGCFHPHMQLVAVTSKPHAAPLGKLRRLGDLNQAEQIGIEPAYR